MPVSAKIKNALWFCLRVGLSIGLLAYLFHKIDIQKTVEIVWDANFFYFLAVLMILIILYFIMLFRWYMVIRAMNLRVPFKSVARFFWIGAFFNLFLPTAAGGDVVKTIGLFKDTDKKTTVVASVLLDRFFGFIGIMIVALFSFAIGYPMAYDLFLLIVMIGLSVVTVVVTVLFFHEPLYAFACRVFSRFERIQRKLMEIHYAFALLKGQGRVIFLTIGMSCVAQVMLALTFYLTAKGLHQDVAFLHCMIFVPLICIISLLPSLGGLGVRDIGSVFLFSRVGVSAATAASMSLLSFIFMVIIGLGGAAFYVFTLHPRRI